VSRLQTGVALETVAAAIRAAGHAVIGRLNGARTVRHEAEAAIRLREQQLSDFFENAPVGLHWVGPDGVLVWANHAELELLGYAHDEYVGHHVAEFHVDPDIVEDILRRLAAGETVREREVALRRKDGTIRHALLDANVWWRDGKFVHARCFTREVTREHLTRELLERGWARAEQQARELEQARNAALAAARAKAEFLANMSHEIRTPMTAMLGYAELLSDSRLRRPERESYIDTIKRNGEYLLRLINDVLDLSKIEAGKLVLEAVTFSLPDLVGEVERLLRGHAAGKGLDFEVTVSTDTPAYVCADPTRIRQILVNLIGNAIKFTETGGVRLTVDVTTAPTPGRQRVRFTVVDTGIGMRSEQQARLFEPFGQADASTTRTFGGTGLGLAISARLAAALGGRIDVQSARGRGSAFTLTLDVDPIGVGPAGPRTGRAEAGSLPILRPRLVGRILLAEDAPDSRRLLSFYLRKAGAQVEIAENGRLACEKVRAAEAAGKPFDLILLDMQMPVMDGYAAAIALRERGVHAPIIALTAHAMDGDRERCLDAGCSDYLTKPVERWALLRGLRAHLDAAGRERRMRAKKTSNRGKRAKRPTMGKGADAEMLALLRLFVDELPRRAAALETSLAERDLEGVGGLAHQLKGSARAYGFPHITDRAAALEESLRAGRDLDDIRAQVETVAALCREVRSR
jgi:PAS domain S-box-containing protein